MAVGTELRVKTLAEDAVPPGWSALAWLQRCRHMEAVADTPAAREQWSARREAMERKAGQRR